MKKKRASALTRAIMSNIGRASSPDVVIWSNYLKSTGEMRAWGTLVGQIASSRGDDCSMADIAKILGVGDSALSKYRRGKLLIPLEKLEPWGRALGLEGEHLENWVILGNLANAPEPIERSFLSMMKELAEYRAELAGFREAMRELGIKVKKG